MMITYKRASNQNYMIMEGEEQSIGYEKDMLQENTIPSLLTFFTMEVNEYPQYWYEITGKKSLRDFFDQEGVTIENLKIAFYGIKDALEVLADYLITEEHIYMDSDTIYFNQSNKQTVSLCYTPFRHESYTEQLRSVMEYIISVVDHHKSDVTRACYRMYELTEQSRFTVLDLIAVLEEKERVDREPTEPIVLQKELSEEDIRRAALDVGEDCFEEKPSKKFVFPEWIKKIIQQKKEMFLFKKNELFPEEDYLEDIEFDEIVPKEKEEAKTVILSEDTTVCCGKLIHDMGGESEDFLISHTPFRIGSKAGGNDAVILSPAVSRYHAKITKQDGIFYLSDLNSLNGTFHNGEPVGYNESVPLKAMDTISFADVVYHIV